MVCRIFANPRMWGAYLLPCIAIFLAGCLAEEVEETGGAVPTWAYIQPAIFSGTGHCTNCHTGTAPPGASYLSLDYDKYTTIVTNGAVARQSDPAGDLIIDPGSKETSFLYRKIIGTLTPSTEGVRMPQDGPPYLTTEDIALIGNWIDAGAPLTSP